MSRNIITILFLIFSFAVFMVWSSSSTDNNNEPFVHVCYHESILEEPERLEQILQEEVSRHERHSQDSSEDHKRFIPFSATGRWSSTAISGSNLQMRQPTIVTWSIVPDGSPLLGSQGEPAAASALKSKLISIYGSEQSYLNQFYNAFNAWSAVAGLTFVYVSSDDGAAVGQPGTMGVRGDIRIGGHPIDGTGNAMGYAWGPQWGFITLDTSDGTYSSDQTTLNRVLQHMIGHAIGLYHSCPVLGTKLMEPVYSASVNSPQTDDIIGVQFFYGDASEGSSRNDQVNTATNLVATGKTGISNLLRVNTLSIDSTSDIDHFHLAVDSNSMLYAQITPLGNTYQNGAVVSGVCPASAPTQDTLRVFDLRFALLDASGNILVSSNTGSLGAIETLSYSIQASSSYYLKVWTATPTPPSQYNSVQLYRLDVGTTAPCNCS